MAEQTEQSFRAQAPGNFTDDHLDKKFEFVDSLTPESAPEAIKEYRNGPRFYVAEVTDGQRNFLIKDLTRNPEANKDLTNLDSPRSHLHTEIEVLRFLQAKSGPEQRIAPDLMLSNDGEDPWYVTSHTPEEHWLGYPDTPFFFRLDRLAKTNPQSIFNSIAALQSLTAEPDVPAWITLDQRAEKYGLGGSDWAVSFLCEQTGVTREDADAAYASAQAARASLPQVLRHGEVYPQHIFVAEGAQTAEFIDWENAKLGDPNSDHAAVWLRSFENPEWQATYYQLVSSQPGFKQEAWKGSVFLAAIGNYRYLSEVPQVEPDRQKAAIEYCKVVALQVGALDTAEGE